MENTVLHKANTRGHADHGWLQANFSFSFEVGTTWHESIWALRVLNDDIIGKEWVLEHIPR
jgi:hypothetical protein